MDMVFNSHTIVIVFRFIQTNLYSHTQISVWAIKKIMNMTEQRTRKNTVCKNNKKQRLLTPNIPIMQTFFLHFLNYNLQVR